MKQFPIKDTLKRKVSKYIPIQKEVLANGKENLMDHIEVVIIVDSIDQPVVHGINNVSARKCVENNPLLGFVDSNTLRNIVLSFLLYVRVFLVV
jgi:hypothetical protein